MEGFGSEIQGNRQRQCHVISGPSNGVLTPYPLALCVRITECRCECVKPWDDVVPAAQRVSRRAEPMFRSVGAPTRSGGFGLIASIGSIGFRGR